MMRDASFESKGVNSLTALLDDSTNADDFARTLTLLIIKRAEETDPELAAMLRACAIPRRVTAVIVGVLRDAPTDYSRNEELFGNLLSYSFVLPQQDGTYAYHESTRTLLLREWQHADEGTDLFKVYNARLASFYLHVYEQVQQAEKDLEQVASIIQRANSKRYVQIASTIESWLLDPLFEALYHETLYSPQSGLNRFFSIFSVFESRDRLLVCRSFLEAMQSNLRGVAPYDERDRHLVWLQTLSAYVSLRQSPSVLTEIHPRDLLNQAGGDVGFKLWLSSRLGSFLTSQYRFREAIEVLEEKLELILASVKEDPSRQHELSALLFQLGTLYYGSLEPDRSAKLLQQAVRYSRLNSDPIAEIQACLQLSNSYLVLGDWGSACNIILDALRLVRTRLSNNRDLHYEIAYQCMSLFGRDARMVDTLFAEANVMRHRTLELLPLRLEYIRVLIEEGQIPQAEQMLKKLQVSSNESAGALDPTQLTSEWALLRDRQGRYNEAITRRTEIIELSGASQHNASSDWAQAYGLLQRGWSFYMAGQLAEGEADLRTSAEKFERTGYRTYAAFVKSVLADVLRRQGQYAQAQEMLTAIQDTVIESGASPILSNFHNVHGNIYRDQASWELAHKHYEQVIPYQLEQQRDLAQTFLELANVAAAQANWSGASKYIRASESIWRSLAQRADYEASAESLEADQYNAQGLDKFSQEVGDERLNKIEARQLFHSAASAVPDNFWYHINEAYCSAALKEWDEAASKLELLIEQGPDWLRLPTLYSHLVGFYLDKVETLFDTNQYEAAAQTCLMLRNRLTDKVSPTYVITIQLKLGDSLTMLSRFDDAIAVYKGGLDYALTLENGLAQISQALFEERVGLIGSLVQEEIMQKFHPQLSVQMPQTWFAKESLTLLAPDGQANIIASSEPLDESVDKRRYAEVQGELLSKEFPGYHELSFEMAEILGGHEGYIRRFEWTPPDGVPVTQIQLYYAESGRGYTATATTPSSQFNRYDLQLRHILGTLAIGGLPKDDD